MTGTPLGDYPQAAIDAGAEALRKAALLDNAGYIEGDEQRAAETVLEAAAPHIHEQLLAEGWLPPRPPSVPPPSGLFAAKKWNP